MRSLSTTTSGFVCIHNRYKHLIAGFYPNDSDVWVRHKNAIGEWVRVHIPARYDSRRLEYMKAAVYQETYNATVGA